MSDLLLAKTEIRIHAPVEKVWDALIDPEQIKKYMFGTIVHSTWEVGSQITWKGEWEGKSYRDYGRILEFIENKKLSYTHRSDHDDENMHTVSIELRQDGDEIVVSLTQDHNSDEESKNESEKNWKMMLESMKKLLEGE